MGKLTEAQRNWLDLLAAMTGGALPALAAQLAPGQAAGPIQAAGVKVRGPQSGSGGDDGDDSWIEFKPQAVLYVDGKVRANLAFDHATAVDINAGESGQLMLHLGIKGMQDNLFSNEEFSQKVDVSWNLSADSTGALTIETPQDTWGAPSSGTYFRLDSINSDKGSTFVQISPVIAGGADSGGVSVGVGIGREAPPPKIKETFRIDIRVKVPKTPDPKVVVEVGKTVTALMSFDYVIGPFKVGDATALTAGTVTKQVYQVLHKMLPPEATKALLQGKLPGDEFPDGTKTGEGEKVEVHGYTSNTDSETRNFALSRKRAQTVLAAFKGLGVPGGVFSEPIPHGEWEVNDDAGMEPTDVKGSEHESDEWRKVVLKIKHSRTVTVP